MTSRSTDGNPIQCRVREVYGLLQWEFCEMQARCDGLPLFQSPVSKQTLLFMPCHRHTQYYFGY